ncbi:hypothetical protein M885DRAFT_577841 [Pelagophyceae sp. CCMP2097]|nr:hypothetical protein M885DRAFT_577841 [Pelagophyceae sp. CCMP2097]
MAVATVQAWLLDGDRWVPLKRDACGGAAAWLKVFVSPPDGDSTAARIDVIDVLTGTLEFEAALSKINALRRIEGSEELFFALDCLEASKTLALRFEDEDAMNRTRGELLAAAGEAEAVEVDAVNPQVLEQRVVRRSALCKHLVATGFSEGDVARAQAALGDGVSFNDCINWIFDNVVEDAPAAPVPAPSPRKAYPAPPPFSPMRPTAAAADALDDAADEAVLVLAKGDFRDASTRVSRRVSWPDEKAQVDDVCTPEVEEVQVRTLQGEEVQARTPQVDEVQARTPLKAKPPPRTKPPPPPPRTKSPPPPERPPAEGPPAEAPPAEAPPAAPTTSRDAVLVVRRKPPPPPMPKKPPPPSLHPSPSLHAAPTGEGAPRQARPQRDAPPAAAAPPPMAAALIPSAHDSRLTANIDDTDAAPAYRGIFSVDLDDVDAPAHGCRLSADFDDTDVAPAYRGSFSALLLTLEGHTERTRCRPRCV